MDKKRRIPVRPLIALLLVAGSLIALYGPSLQRHVVFGSNPLCFSDDAAMYIFPFLKFREDSLSQDDYAADYMMACCPTGYRALYKWASRFHDPRIVSKVLSYALSLVFLVTAGLTAWKLGGWAATWGTLALALSSSLFLDRMMGGLPRAFGFPLIAGAAAALVFGRPVLLAALTPMAILLYPPLSVVMGISLAIYLLVLPRRYRGRASEWSVARRMRVLAVSGGLTLVLAVPGFLSLRPYGPMIGPADLEQFPEAKNGGRVRAVDRIDYRGNMFKALWNQSVAAMGSQGKPWSKTTRLRHGWSPHSAVLLRVVLSGVVIGFFWLCFRRAAYVRLLVLFAAMCIAYPLAVMWSPLLFLPRRHLDFVWPLILILCVPSAIGQIPGLIAQSVPRLRNRFRTERMRAPATMIVSIACLLFWGGRVHPTTGQDLRVEMPVPVYEFLRTLPADSMVGGWPDAMSFVPYIAQRSTFVNRETHLPYHRKYTEVMRDRMRDLRKAYFAQTLDPLLRLRDQYGVTHLVVNMNYVSGQLQPTYFYPFKSWIMKTWEAYDPSDSEIIRQLPFATIFESGSVRVLDLGRLHPGTTATARN